MSISHWRRPLVLAVASVALATGTACAAQAASYRTAGTHHAAPADPHLCGHGGKGGAGGEGGKGGAPGRPGEPGRPGRPGCLAIGELPDRNRSDLTGLDRTRIVLAVESGQAKKDDVIKKYKISEKEFDTWDKQFREGNWATLTGLNSLFGS